MDIKYVLWLQIALNELDREVNFLFRMPTLFDTYEQAQAAEHDFYIRPALRFSGEVVFEIYKRAESKDGLENSEGPIDVIRWSEYWKYECRIRKENAIESLLAEIFPDINVSKLDLPADVPNVQNKVFIPYADPFEMMYKKYLSRKTLEEVCETDATCITYMVRPMCVKNRNLITGD